MVEHNTLGTQQFIPKPTGEEWGSHKWGSLHHRPTGHQHAQRGFWSSSWSMGTQWVDKHTTSHVKVQSHKHTHASPPPPPSPPPRNLHTQTHAHTQTYMYIHARTHTHTHSRKNETVYMVSNRSAIEWQCKIYIFQDVQTKGSSYTQDHNVSFCVFCFGRKTRLQSRGGRYMYLQCCRYHELIQERENERGFSLAQRADNLWNLFTQGKFYLPNPFLALIPAHTGASFPP